MELTFYKYQGTGNDFILIDNRQELFPKNDTKAIAMMCDRKFGIGADGLILLEDHFEADFTMVYFNADGRPSSMCGNGGRCIALFAQTLGIIDTEASFEAVDGMHYATIEGETVSLKMQEVSNVSVEASHCFLDTGSPHHVTMVDDVFKHAVVSEGRRIRNEVYGAQGANVNFVSAKESDTFTVRTYERGVEDETLSCGTGVVAVALAMYSMGKAQAETIAIETMGGMLEVQFDASEVGFRNIYLKGPAKEVFKGTFTL
ncbi:diaminopimelate epimerase [Altibacter sp. HG106]|uniref:diaminopimelate epimerase n=1 Tax=Altibacter sp. HG106 TaxID=3023937 RepID=UPI00234FE1AE|nr:diaminopimelate epimerase [Altibacter sp. HG106]MDC7995607.1 diaminopimelate epimerase [Altibacter sp. HG106]